MKDRIQRLVKQQIHPVSSRKKDRELILANMTTSSNSSCLSQLISEFSLLDPLLRDCTVHPSHQPDSPTGSPQPPSDPKIEHLKVVYSTYSPVHDSVAEIERLAAGLEFASRSPPQEFLQAVHEEYARRGGVRSLGELEEKLQADLMYLIRRENEQTERERQKYY